MGKGVEMRTFYDLVEFRARPALEVELAVNRKEVYNRIIYDFKSKWQRLITTAKWLPATQFILKRGYLKHLK